MCTTFTHFWFEGSCSSCSDTKPSLPFIVHCFHIIIHSLQSADHSKMSLTTCCPNIKHVSSPWSLLYYNMVLRKKVRGLLPLSLPCVLTPSVSSHTPPWPHCIHLINFLMCVFVSWSVAITKWWPLLTRRPLSTCRLDLHLNSLLVRPTQYYIFSQLWSFVFLQCNWCV